MPSTFGLGAHFFNLNVKPNTNDRWSVFEADLQPGNFTAILTRRSPVTLADWGPFAPESATFEYCGPECGIEGATRALANTGVDTIPTLVGRNSPRVAGVGVAAVAVRRRLVKQFTKHTVYAQPSGWGTSLCDCSPEVDG